MPSQMRDDLIFGLAASGISRRVHRKRIDQMSCHYACQCSDIYQLSENMLYRGILKDNF